MKHILFFATPADIVPVLQRFESNTPLKFVEMGTSSTPNRPVYLESSEIPNPGTATHETGSMSRGYMVSHRDAINHVSVSVSKRGDKLWNLFNSDNGEATTLTMAGIWKIGTLLPGSMTTLQQTPAAQQLMRWFQSALKQEGFTKFREWWVGKEAVEMLKAGKRLTTTAEQSPPQFDLKFQK